MDLLDLEKEESINLNTIKVNKNKIVEKRKDLEAKAIDYSKVVVQTSHNNNDPFLIAIAQIIEMEKNIEQALINLEEINAKKEIIYKSVCDLKERDYQIFIEKVFKKMSNAKISIRHGGISKWTINRIVKKIEKKIKNL